MRLSFSTTLFIKTILPVFDGPEIETIIFGIENPIQLRRSTTKRKFKTAAKKFTRNQK